MQISALHIHIEVPHASLTHIYNPFRAPTLLQSNTGVRPCKRKSIAGCVCPCMCRTSPPSDRVKHAPVPTITHDYTAIAMTTSADDPNDHHHQQPQHLTTPQTPVLTVACRILRSPSHESVTTDLSLFSVSSAASEGGNTRRLFVGLSSGGQGFARGSSPNPECREHGRPSDIPEILWFEEETDLIRSCAALSSAVGLQKSFSTSDISQLPTPDGGLVGTLRGAVSDLALSSLQRSGYLLEHARLDQTSRSCSTWVAVGDVASTSQLPSPHGGHSTTLAPTANTPTPPPAFTAADFIRSVNKKVRQNYIKRRLLTTYKALERLSQSEFNLDRLEVTPSTAAASVGSECASATAQHLTVPGQVKQPQQQQQQQVQPPVNSTNAAVLRVVKQRASRNLPLTIRDVERERGKPLSKYERNMMIFNWLHTLDETAVVEGVQ